MLTLIISGCETEDKSAVKHQCCDPQGLFTDYLIISHPNEFLNKENKTTHQQRKLLQSNTILQRTISEKDLMASDQQEKKNY